MAARSAIEWTDASWTPIRARVWEIQDDGSGKQRIGWHCEHVSEGCRFCYAEGFNRRLGTGFAFKPGNLRGKPGYAGGGSDHPELFLDEQMLRAPLRWKKPRMVFVCAMTDLFADFVRDQWIDKMFAVMALCPQHRFQILTKRAARMREYFLGKHRYRDVHPLEDRADAINEAMDALAPQHWCKRELQDYSEEGLPLPNVHLGVSCERQQEADERIPHLLLTPAAVRFISAEPLLGPIDLTRLCGGTLDALLGHDFEAIGDIRDCGDLSKAHHPPGLDWVIAGGESGVRARAHSSLRANFRSLRDQCAAAGVAFFHKQNGEFIDADEWLDMIERGPSRLLRDGQPWKPARPLNYEDAARLAGLTGRKKFEHQSDGTTLIRVGKKAAGRLLDGRTHDEFPEAAR